MRETASPDTLDLLRRRRSVAPAFLEGPGPSDGELADILTLAARVPDHGKLAPWRFIVFSGAARLRAGEIIAAAYLADHPDASPDRLALEGQRLAHAPVVVGLVSRAAPHVKISEWEQVLSAGAVAMNLTIAAKAHGFSGCWLTEWYSYHADVPRQLGVSAHERIVGFFHLGHATIQPDDRVRPVMADIVTHF